MSGDAEVLIARAEALLAAPEGGAVGNSARLAAFLLRQAAEELIDDRCAVLCGVPTVTGTMKAKLAVMKSLDAGPVGAALISVWYRLTGFCHQHAYQLAPTVSEVRVQCRTLQQALLGEISGGSLGNTTIVAGAPRCGSATSSTKPGASSSRSRFKETEDRRS